MFFQAGNPSFFVLFYRKSSYNRDITYDSDEEDVDDFINDDDDDDDDDEEGVAESPSTSSPDIPESESDSERDSEASLKSQSRLKSTNNLISRPKSKGVLSSSENESDAGGKKHDQKNSMKIRRKCGIKRKKIDTDNSSTDNDTDEEINNSQHRIHKANILRDDDSCDDRSDYELTKFQNSTNSQLLSRKSSRAERLKKQQLEDKERKFLALKRKRELAKLPLDKRKEAEEKIKQEELSECISADEETPGATFIEIFADAFCENELDKNFVVSGTDSEDELLNAKKRKDFDAFLQSLARSDIEKEPDREGESVSPGNEKPENRIENGKDRADQSSFTPKLKRKDAGRYRKVMILSDSEDDSEVKIEPSVKKLFSLVQNETSIGSVKDTLKQNDIPINSKGEKGRTVLHLVSIKGNLELLEFFLQHNALPNVYDDYGLLPICYAALWKNVKCLKALLPVSDLSGMQRSLHKYMEGMSFLHVITLNGPKTDTDEEEDIKVECLQIVKDFNKKMYESMLSKVDSRGYSPIVAAISDGHVKVNISYR